MLNAVARQPSVRPSTSHDASLPGPKAMPLKKKMGPGGGKLTVLLGGHFEGHVLRFQLLVGLLQETDVVDRLPQNGRLVQLPKNKMVKGVWRRLR